MITPAAISSLIKTQGTDSRMDPRASTRAPASCAGPSSRFRSRASSATTPGRTIRGPTPATSRSGRSMSADEELGYLYLPTEHRPRPTIYGGHRPGNNLFAESVVVPRRRRPANACGTSRPCITGCGTTTSRARRSCSTSPSTAAASRRVAQVTKQGFVYTFDRVTGKPVWPIEERPVPPSDVPGEKALADAAVPIEAGRRSSIRA